MTICHPLQALADVFKDEWVSALPLGEDITTGTAPLFDDYRLKWFTDQVDVGGMRVLELGTLEGGHTYTLARLGADVTSIECSPDHHRRAKMAQALLGYKAELLLDDFRDYLARKTTGQFDLIVACGVLYHMKHPLALLWQIAKHTDLMFLWTHYYERSLIARWPTVLRMPGNCLEVGRYGGHIHVYGHKPPWHLGGMDDFSVWLERQDIEAAIEEVGFTKRIIGCDEPDYENGPAFAVLARKEQT